jgi:hypothetical protein
MGVDPALILAQVSQGERLAHEIRNAPLLAQAATAEAAPRLVIAAQQPVQDIEKSEASKSQDRKVEDQPSRQSRQGEQHQRRRLQLFQKDTGTAASDSQTDEVSGIIVNTSA